MQLFDVVRKQKTMRSDMNFWSVINFWSDIVFSQDIAEDIGCRPYHKNIVNYWLITL